MASAIGIAWLTWAEGAVRQGLPWGRVTLRQVWLVCAKTSGAGGLSAAVGKHHCEVGNYQSTGRRNGRDPACARSEQDDRQDEAGHAEGHHDQITAFPVGNVLRARPGCL